MISLQEERSKECSSCDDTTLLLRLVLIRDP